MKVHQIKIDFNVTEQIKRFVYVYILEAESLYRHIMHERVDNVDARALIVEGET